MVVEMSLIAAASSALVRAEPDRILHRILTTCTSAQQDGRVLLPRRRHRDLLRDLRRPGRSGDAADHGPRHPDGGLARRLLRAARRSAATSSSATTTATSGARRSSTARRRRRCVQLARRDKRAAAYTLADMAGDSVGVLDHLGIEQAHIVGASMGGMIAQTIAIRHPHRTLSLVSIMSNTGGFWNGQPALTMYAAAAQAVAARARRLHPARRRHVHQDRRLGLRARRRGPARHRDPSATTAGTTRAARSASSPRSSPTATARRSCASSRSPRRSSTAPTTSSSGRAAAARPRRRSPARSLVEIPGMGHGLPRGAWPTDHRRDRRHRGARRAAAAALTPVRR